MMTYDYNGAWSNTELGHQTNLYAASWDPNTKYTTDKAVNLMLAQGVDPASWWLVPPCMAVAGLA